LVKPENPAAYGAQFQKWDLQAYPCIPETFRLQVKADTEGCYQYAKQFFDKADWLINATDADREGELIFAYVYQMMGCVKPWKRVWIEDLTNEKIRYAFSHLRSSEKMQGLQLAGRARSAADWLFGMNITVAMTQKFSNHNGVLACGRVQTPTLALVVNRENEIRNFTKKPFYKVVGNFSTENGGYSGEYQGGNLDTKEQADDVLSNAKGEGVIKELTVKESKVSAPLLYNSTQLQVACGKTLGWELKKAEQVMQQLYEAKLMTYPRTSSEHLTVAMEPEIARTIEKIMAIPEYAAYALDKDAWQEFSSRHFNDSKVGSHPAITPTLNVPQSLEAIENKDMRALYDLLCKSLLRIVFPPATVENTKVVTRVGDVDFVSKGSVIAASGWYQVDAMPEKKNVLPVLHEGEAVTAEIKIEQGETKPPKRYTETELISAMELAGQKLEDEEARTLMKLQKKGLGTDATRVPTIKALFAREYIAKKGKTIYPTEKGMFLINTLPVSEMKSAEMTGELEKELNDIAEGRADYQQFIDKVKGITRKWYKAVCDASSDAFTDKSMLCPSCGKKLVKGKTNVFCSGYKEGCQFSIPYTLCQKKLTDNQIQMLIHSQRTNVIKGFTSKAGKSFDASLKIDSQGKIEFVFPNTKKGKKK
ncbi:MAG: topoisomerase C-terminal repeat-containing protein, partial [Ruminococcus sp.]|nr:topoisomerase C-terminal repeat-containing protein [Ruminococcus sp.]